jgi:hypothetical protein
MVTLVNYDSNDSVKKYNFIFEKAWQDLKAEGIIVDNTDKTQFADLGDYFSYLKDLIQIDTIYMMLPVDETPFRINANDRTIEVPPAFLKCSGVQSDNYAEIITFTIDRYFDYQDLSNLNIAIQWINAEGRQGVSFIDLIDLETLKNEHKIRFGWPLSSEMTAAQGNLTFAVRFFKTSRDNEGQEKFEYVFNTAPASIPIKSTLNVPFYGDDSVVKKFNESSLFRNYIENSPNPSFGLPTKTTIIEKLPESAVLENNQLTLYAQATTKDRNSLTYQWKYCNDPEHPEEGIVLTTASIEDLGLEDVYKIETGFTPYNPKYWPENKPSYEFWTPVLDEDSNPTSNFEEYKGKWPI